MRKLNFKIFAAVIISSLAGCKLDPPIYPSSGTSNPTTAVNTTVKGAQKTIMSDSLSHTAHTK